MLLPTTGGKMVKILIVAGARPNFMKIASLVRALEPYSRFEVKLMHTGQHYDEAMSMVFFEELGLPRPNLYLGVGSGTQATQTAKIMVACEGVIEEEAPDLMVVVGDVNSALGCSIVAAKAGTTVAHVEAGLRSFDRTMPEEINRIVTDSLSEIFFTTSADADENLLREGHKSEQIHLVGNTMIDTLLQHKAAAVALSLEQESMNADGYILVTLHRPSNVDDPERLRAILLALADLPLPVIFPVHPRTRHVAEQTGLDGLLSPAGAIAPVGYLQFLHLQIHAAVVLTDSGGVQEETTALGVPCLTFRENTERPITITHGTNRLIGTNPARILPEIEEMLHNTPIVGEGPPLWDGRAGERIAEVLNRLF
jgi:UDP-N-acetylglucosamine 2-epimerase (non-hydrolysing)